MSNPQKRKGSDFERLAVDIFNRLIRKSIWRRIPGSGAIGTILSESLLTADIKGEMEAVPKKFKVEAKVGYNSSKDKEIKQFTLKKEWLDKVALEAQASYGIPMLVGKFSGARDGTKVFVVMDVEVFADLMNRITELHEDLLKLGVDPNADRRKGVGTSTTIL